MTFWKNLPEGDKNVVDFLSALGVLGVFMEIVPAAAAIMTLLWTIIRVYETDTVKKLINKFKGKKNG